jgi:hypothetical protein
MAISEGRKKYLKSGNFGTFFFHQNPLYEWQWIFLGAQVTKFQISDPKKAC